MAIDSDEVMWTERALAAAHTIERQLYVPARGLYGTRQFPFGHRYEFLWPFACAWSAACSLGSVNGAALEAVHLSSFLRGVSHYHQRHEAVFGGNDPVGFSSAVVGAASNGREVYFDDNAWIALALLHQHSLTGEAPCLNLARRVLHFVLTGWSTNERWTHPGGIRWKQPLSSTTRNVCSNAPVAEAAIELYVRTGERDWIEWAVRIYEWTKTTLQNSALLYADHIEPNGVITPTIWTYNQGTMIGAGVLLAQVTNETHYLNDAAATADRALGMFDVDALTRQPVSFNAVLLRNLLLLDRVRPDRRIETLATGYGESLWSQHGDAMTAALSGSTGSPLNRSAPIVEIYSLLAGADPIP